MERFEEYMVDTAGPLGRVTDAAELAETEFHEHEEHVTESVYTDDPVRVYLREMGSVRLLSRNGEIELAKRLERGKLRTRKALSRSPMVWRSALAMYDEVRDSSLRLEDVVELGSTDEDVREEARAQINKRFATLARVHRELSEVERRI